VAPGPRRPPLGLSPLPRATLLATLGGSLVALVAGVEALLEGWGGVSDALAVLMVVGMAAFALVSLQQHERLRRRWGERGPTGSPDR
jgi:hypothetical protein